MPNAPFAALFDMDGVIVPNATYHLKAWYQFAANHGVTLTEADYMAHMNGHIASDSLEFLFGQPLSADELRIYTEEKESVYRDLYRAVLAPTRGLIPFLDALNVHNVRLAVGTSAPVSNIGFTLDGLQIRAYFDVVVDASMIQRGKPDPEIYQQAAERVGVLPNRCIVFEDAFAGIEAGVRAGMKVVALTTTHTRDELLATGANLIIDDFTQIRVNPDLLDLLNG